MTFPLCTGISPWNVEIVTYDLLNSQASISIEHERHTSLIWSRLLFGRKTFAPLSMFLF